MEAFDRDLISPELLRLSVEFLPYRPYTMADVESCYDHVRPTNGDAVPEPIAGRLYQYNQAIGNDSSALQNCKRLQDRNAKVVVTGQQAGILTGPVLTIYKILTAINLARRLENVKRSPVIPIFWNATEDHDIDEISSLVLPDREWRSDHAHHGVAAESLTTNQFVGRVLDNYLSSISPVNRRDEIRSLISIGSDHYGMYASSVVARLFRGYGVVVLEPRLLRPAHVEFFQLIIGMHRDVTDQLLHAAARLAAAGVEPAFQPELGDTGLYYINPSGVRRKIQKKNERYQIDGRGEDEGTVRDLVEHHPERFSTGAWLRPLLQSKALPVVAYVAGPSEFQYHCQLRPIFELLRIRMPVIFPRNHATVLTRKELKIATRLTLDPSDYFTGPTPHYHQLELPSKYQDALTQTKESIEEIMSTLQSRISELTTDRQYHTYRRRIQRQLDMLTAKLRKSYNRMYQVDNARIDRLFRCIFPMNRLQERVINVFYFIECNGVEFIRKLSEQFDPLDRRHYIVHTDY